MPAWMHSLSPYPNLIIRNRELPEEVGAGTASD